MQWCESILDNKSWQILNSELGFFWILGIRVGCTGKKYSYNQAILESSAHKLSKHNWSCDRQAPGPVPRLLHQLEEATQLLRHTLSKMLDAKVCIHPDHTCMLSIDLHRVREGWTAILNLSILIDMEVVFGCYKRAAWIITCIFAFTSAPLSTRVLQTCKWPAPAA